MYTGLYVSFTDKTTEYNFINDWYVILLFDKFVSVFQLDILDFSEDGSW